MPHNPFGVHGRRNRKKGLPRRRFGGTEYAVPPPRNGDSVVRDCGHAELVETIHTWAKAYPESVFPEPPAGEHGQSVDACSARALRHAFKVLVGLLPE